MIAIVMWIVSSYWAAVQTILLFSAQKDQLLAIKVVPILNLIPPIHYCFSWLIIFLAFSRISELYVFSTMVYCSTIPKVLHLIFQYMLISISLEVIPSLPYSSCSVLEVWEIVLTLSGLFPTWSILLFCIHFLHLLARYTYVTCMPTCISLIAMYRFHVYVRWIIQHLYLMSHIYWLCFGMCAVRIC